VVLVQVWVNTGLTLTLKPWVVLLIDEGFIFYYRICEPERD
jgi:hypothetical protein